MFVEERPAIRPEYADPLAEPLRPRIAVDTDCPGSTGRIVGDIGLVPLLSAFAGLAVVTDCPGITLCWPLEEGGFEVPLLETMVVKIDADPVTGWPDITVCPLIEGDCAASSSDTPFGVGVGIGSDWPELITWPLEEDSGVKLLVAVSMKLAGPLTLMNVTNVPAGTRGAIAEYRVHEPVAVS